MAKLTKMGYATLSLTPEFQAQLVEAGIEKTVVDAIAVAVANSLYNVSGYVYARALPQAFAEYYTAGVKEQVMYMRLYLVQWRGEEARATKKILDAWLKTFNGKYAA